MNNIPVLLIIAVISFIIPAMASSQTNEKVFPKIIVHESGKDFQLKLDNLAIEVNVVENIAVTTYKMVFLNTENRVMEGELEFPLNDGQTVSRFAMDMNGVLREGVVVEKAKGRETFEKIVRRGVDPGLLEQTKGNVFRTRVYPIPANGRKTVVLSYEQELTDTGNKSIYILPLQFETKIAQFSIDVEVLKQPFELSPSQNGITNFMFEKWNESYKAHAEFRNYCPDKQLAFEIPQVENATNIYVEKFSKNSDNSYFYLHVKPKKLLKSKSLPHRICILWDASSSASKKDIEKELKVLAAYFNRIGSLEVQLITFRNEPDKPIEFVIKNSDCTKFLNYIRKIAYDGGTQLGAIDLTNYQCDEFILSSDGMSNFGESEIKLSQTPIVVINSNVIADYSYLKYLASSTGGQFINLTKLNLEDAVSNLASQEYHFISTTFLSKSISETYPSLPAAFENSFTLAGKLKGKNGRLVLNFGVGAEIMQRDTIEISQVESNSAGIVKRLWAEKAISELDMRYDKNKERITAIGKEFGIVTRNTSLIVLDRLEDYVDNQIVPPSDMQKDYFAMVESRTQSSKREVENHIEDVVRQFEQRKAWWNRDPKSFRKEVVSKPYNRQPNTRRRNNSNTSSNNSNIYDRGRVTQGTGVNIAGRITGRITDINSGEPLPGVNVIVKGTTSGTVSNMEGRYLINIPANAVLVFSYIGYITEEVNPGANQVIDAALVEDVRQLEEVVVVGYGTRLRGLVTGAISGLATDKSISETNENEIDSDPGRASILLNAWDPQSPYMDALEAASRTDFYHTYLELKKEYENTPSFYLDVADFLNKNDEPILALRVLSNIAELKTENHQLLRVLAHRLQQLGYHNLSVKVFRDVLSMRQEEPQSYRDLGLALAENNQSQEAIDILYSLILKKWDSRFPGIEVIAVNELNNIIAQAKKILDLSKIDNRLLENMPVNVRVVLNWDADNCDMDLWVTSPDGEKCFYGNKTSQTGGQISNDFTGGYGPEEFLIKKAQEGKYTIEVNYYGTRQQKLTGPTTIQVELYTNYGTKNQKKEEITLRLAENKEVVTVGELLFTE